MADLASEPVLRDLAIGDAGWLIQQHAGLYARSEGFDRTASKPARSFGIDLVEQEWALDLTPENPTKRPL